MTAPPQTAPPLKKIQREIGNQTGNREGKEKEKRGKEDNFRPTGTKIFGCPS